MSEEQLKIILRDMREAYNKGDIERIVSLYAEDATLVAPEGTFKGKEEIKRYQTWTVQSLPDLTITDAGIGIIVEGNKAVREYVLEAKYEGVKWSMAGTSVFEFSDGKIQHHRAFYDRTLVAKQLARGWLARRTVNSMLKRMEKGVS